jgi:hypothetical protein
MSYKVTSLLVEGVRHAYVEIGEDYDGGGARNGYVNLEGHSEQAVRLNTMMAEHVRSSGSLELFTDPVQINMDISTACDMKCPFCPYHGDMPHTDFTPKKRLMDMDTMADILDAFPNCHVISLGCSGEPFLHPKLPDIVDLCAERHPHSEVHISTDGLRADRFDIKTFFAKANIKVINFSIDTVLPRRELFSREHRKASASIILKVRGNRTLDPGQVTAVQALVAAAVPGLKPERVSLVDDRGNLLSRQNDPNDPSGSGTLGKMRLSYESRIKEALESMIERSVGIGNVRVEVSAKDHFVYLLVQNPAPESTERQHQGNRVALSNTQARLQALFGEPAVLKHSRQGNTYTVTLRLPRRSINTSNRQSRNRP